MKKDKMKKVTIALERGGHTWRKLNVVTINKAGSLYDEYECINCKVKGKSYTLGTITLPENRVRCKAQSFLYQNQIIHIRITECGAYIENSPFANCAPNSVHRVIPPPEGESDANGYWIMGVGEPVLILSGEYEIVLQMKRTKFPKK